MSEEELQKLYELLQKFYNEFHGDDDGSSEASDVNSTIGLVLFQLEK